MAIRAGSWSSTSTTSSYAYLTTSSSHATNATYVVMPAEQLRKALNPDEECEGCGVALWEDDDPHDLDGIPWGYDPETGCAYCGKCTQDRGGEVTGEGS